MYLSIIVLPLLGCIVSGFFGRKVGVTGSRFLSCLSIITTTILAIIGFFELGFNNNQVSINLFRWLDSESFNMVWNFQFDSLTVSMLIPVLIISSLVHIYSIGYMSHDPHNQRFFSYLSLFTFMMIILVTGDNYLLMFVGWEGVGVCSYLLVSFWFTRIAANQSSLAAFLTNRVGDCLLTIGMFVILWSLGSLDYNVIFSLAPYINENVITMIGICLLIGAMAKSSQLGLHIWLPMAMEGPTPVSALIHAATMVTAGVYLLIRSSPLIEYSSTVLLLCLWLGAITTVFSSLVGLFQQDIKKIIAYSTMSQLGMMVIAIGLSSYNIAIFHLINHAFYKGLLFLGAGAVIHAVVDNQDLRKYGGLMSLLPLTYTVILIASLSLVAFPFMTGFYSKDFILESAYGQYCFSSINVYFIAVIGAIFTTLYSVKVIYLTFLAKPNGPVNYYKNAHEGDIFLSLPLIILALFSIYFGNLTKDIFIGLGSGFFTDNSIFIHPMHEILIDTEFAVAYLFKLLPLILTVLFSALAILYPEFIPRGISSFKFSNLGYYIFGFFNQRFLLEFFYNKYIVKTVLDIGGQTTKILDKGSIEWVGPYGMGVVLTTISKTVSNLSKGVVTDYALYILISICLYLSIYTFAPNTENSVIVSSVIVLIAIHSYIVSLSDEPNVPFELVSSLVISGEFLPPKHLLNFTRTFSTTPCFSADRGAPAEGDGSRISTPDPVGEDKGDSAEDNNAPESSKSESSEQPEASGEAPSGHESADDEQRRVWFEALERMINNMVEHSEQLAYYRIHDNLMNACRNEAESSIPEPSQPAESGDTNGSDDESNYNVEDQQQANSDSNSETGVNVEDKSKQVEKSPSESPSESGNVEDQQQANSGSSSESAGGNVEDDKGKARLAESEAESETGVNVEDKGKQVEKPQSPSESGGGNVEDKGVKRERSGSDSDNDRKKIQKTDTEDKKESCVDFVLEKQQCEMADIFEGGRRRGLNIYR